MGCSMQGFLVHHQTPRTWSNSCPSSRWCHPTIWPSVVPFYLQSFPASGSFYISSSHQVAKVLGVSSSAWVFPMNIQNWFPLGLVGSPCSPRYSQESSPKLQFKSINSSGLSFLYSPTLTSTLTTGKTIALTRWTFVDKVMSLHFNMLSRLFITFLPRSKHLLISWLKSSSAVILEPRM